MKLSVELDVYDAVEILRRVLTAKFGQEVEDITIRSWNTELMRVVGGTLEEPVRHHLRPDHSALFPSGRETYMLVEFTK